MRTPINIIRAIYDRWFLDDVAFARKSGVRVGADCRIFTRKLGSEPYLITLGNHVTISQDVTFINHDGGVWVFRKEYPDLDVFGTIVIEDNCFIGANATILPGVRIGANSIVGAASLVNRDIPSDSMAAGVPARVIGSIAEYKAKKLAQTLDTKRLTEEQKRETLLKHFRLK